ncbi:uncharacterized protein J8A68_005445 [[Candida] subhashii]|uniref:Uncharacterized protein n=1 Tax=[Candida] subhashii TaxID=561895 RepID=A0A8J5QHN8_9ASCO|nr:uncharacterized protein J8A68_005445 [[Candida] subhashii]KAG7661073.1 hypothetical protein J8A68_005445 [[Candida] subhashii]
MNSLKTKSGERTKSAPNNRTRYDNYDTTSSILSDYEEMDFVDIEQSSYVLFNPVRSIQTRNTSDILSLTNTATHTYSSDSELEEGDEEEGEDKEEEHTEIKGQEEENDEEEEEEEETELSDSKYHENDVADIFYSARSDHLSNKINSWYNSNNNALIHSHLLMNEDVASWNLDETVMSGSSTTARSSTRLMIITEDEASKVLLKQFYGDELFQYLNKEEIAKVKKFHKLIDIKDYLLDKDQESNQTSLLSQLIYKVLMLNNNNKNETSISSSFQEYTKVNYPRCAAAGTTDYINYLHRIPPSENIATVAPEISADPMAFSETTNSSVIMCGGYGSWNDVN